MRKKIRRAVGRPEERNRGLWRVLDANLNRSREGLRVCEDLVRFVLSDKKLTHELKTVRHELNRAFSFAPARWRRAALEARDSERDVGKIFFIRDAKKMRLEDLLRSNFKRVEESLRSLEECSKILLPRAMRCFQTLRFRVYELEKKIAARL